MATRWGMWLKANTDIVFGGNAVAFNNRALCYLEADKFALALEDLNRAVHLDPKLAAAYTNRAWAHYGLEKFKLALADAQTAIDLDPQLLDAYNQRALARRMLGDVDGALQDLNLILAQQPANAKVLTNRAATYYCQRQWQAAIDDCEAAIRLDRAEFSAWFWLAESLLELRRFEEMRAAAAQALVLQPEHVEARVRLAFALLQLNELPEALANAERCVQSGPKLPDAYNVRGLIRHTLGDVAGAIDDYTAAVERNPKPGTFSSRGLAYQQLGEFDKALADYEEEMVRHPEFAISYNNRGYLFHLQGRFREARSDYEAAMARAPGHPNAYKNLAWLQSTCPLQEFRSAAEALRNIQQALELDAWRVKPWLEILAAAHAEAGDFKEALHWQEQAIAALNGTAAALGQRRLEEYRQQRAWREPVAFLQPIPPEHIPGE